MFSQRQPPPKREPSSRSARACAWHTPRCEPGAFPALSSGVGAAIAMRFEGAAPQGDDVAKDSGNGHWRNRIIEYGTRPASQFQAHPRNWRKHPKAQREALAASLNGVGWVGVVLENARTGHLLDGHERLWQALEQGDETPVPYITVDLAEDEEHLVLATLDPIGAMAQTDAEMLEGILSELRETELVQEDGALERLLAEVGRGVLAPGDDDWAAAFGNLPDGERAPFQQMTFTLHDEQAEVVARAVAQAKRDCDFSGQPNENSNGNALYMICRAYVNGFG